MTDARGTININKCVFHTTASNEYVYGEYRRVPRDAPEVALNRKRRLKKFQSHERSRVFCGARLSTSISINKRLTMLSNNK